MSDDRQSEAHGPPIVVPVLESGVSGVLLWSAIATIVGAVALVVGFVVDPAQTFFGYLSAYTYGLSIALGALILLLTCNAMDAKWPTIVRRLMESISATLPLYALLFVPILFGMGRLYPWMHPERIVDAHARELVVHKLPYLNVPFFVVRAVVCFVIWSTTALLLRRWSLQNDEVYSERRKDRAQALSAAMLPVTAITLTVAAIDWVMSITPTWISTMFGIYFWSGGFVAAISLVALLAWFCDRRGLIRGLKPSHYHALGRLMLAFVIFWGYSGFFQYMLIWIANLPIDVTFFVPRSQGNWAVVSIVLASAQFFIPFLVLLFWQFKRSGGRLAVMAAWIVAVHFIDAQWMVTPSVRIVGAPYRWMDFAALAFVAGITTLAGTLLLRKRPMMPTRDPALAKALRYEAL
jgi:hypothetical protein